MKKFIAICLVVIMSVFYLISCIDNGIKSSDGYIRERVVMLLGDNGAECSGIEIKAPSGNTYILTAAHCRLLASKDGKMTAVLESGKKYQVKVIAIDIKHDLMLIQSADGKSIDVAKSIGKHQKMHTMTHGGRYPAYRTDGEMLEERTLKIMGSPIESQEDFDNCPITAYSSPSYELFGIFCMMTMTMHISTAYVIPGSSGGPALDSNGRLIGIVSCTADLFSGLVPLHDIIEFLKDK